MRRRSSTWRWFLSLAVVAATMPASASAPAAELQNKKPSIKLRANPTAGFAPLRVVVTAELTGGANDFEDFYCASVEWDWGDGTKSEVKADCDPYEAGKSEITRRFTQEHTFRATSVSSSPFSPSSATQDMSGNTQPVPYRIRFSLKQKSKTVGSSQTTIELRGGFRDGGE